MSEISESRLSEMRERLAAITPGPWRTVTNLPRGPWADRDSVPVASDGQPVLSRNWKEACLNAAFIAHAPSDLEALLAEVEAMRDDLRLAAGELLVPIPKPGSDMSRLLGANVLLRRENERLRASLDPSSAPSETHDADCCCATCYRNHCCGDLSKCGYQCPREGWVPAGSPEREAGSGTDDMPSGGAPECATCGHPAHPSDCYVCLREGITASPCVNGRAPVPSEGTNG